MPQSYIIRYADTRDTRGLIKECADLGEKYIVNTAEYLLLRAVIATEDNEMQKKRLRHTDR
jgi:hypothetical protein